MTAYVSRAAFLIGAILLPAMPSLGQQSTAIPRVGFVMPSTPEASAQLIDAFRQGLKESGYMDGDSIKLEFRWQPADRPDLLPTIVSELVRSKPDVLVGPTTPQALALKNATSTIPIVMVVPGDPVGSGLVETLARPGGNVTGTAWISQDIMGKRVQFLKEMLPGASRLGLIWNPANPATHAAYRELASAARTLGMTLHSAEVRSPDDFVSALASVRDVRANALLVQIDQLTWTYRQQITRTYLKIVEFSHLSFYNRIHGSIAR
jgi:putative ABC transport system substrate-binding protein